MGTVLRPGSGIGISIGTVLRPGSGIGISKASIGTFGLPGSGIGMSNAIGTLGFPGSGIGISKERVAESVEEIIRVPAFGAALRELALRSTVPAKIEAKIVFFIVGFKLLIVEFNNSTMYGNAEEKGRNSVLTTFSDNGTYGPSSTDLY